MKAKRQHSFLILCLVITLLMSGMCMDDFYADSFLSFEQAKHSAATIDTADRALISSVACTEELISQRNITSVMQRFKRASEKNFSKTDLSLSLVETSPQTFLLSYFTIADSVPQDNLSNSVIIHFIHHKDGKKA